MRTRNVDFCTYLNPDSLTVVQGWVEACVRMRHRKRATSSSVWVYFCTDRRDHQPGRLVFNRTVTLKDSWAKEQA